MHQQIPSQTGQNTMSDCIVVSSDRYNDVWPYSCRTFHTDTKKWGAIFPWDFPQGVTRDVEEEFLKKWFSQAEIHMQGGADGPGLGYRFLKQVWYTIAMFNEQVRLPLMERWWWDQPFSKELLSDDECVRRMLAHDASPSNFALGVGAFEVYGERFIHWLVKRIQYTTSIVTEEKKRNMSFSANYQESPVAVATLGPPNQATEPPYKFNQDQRYAQGVPAHHIMPPQLLVNSGVEGNDSNSTFESKFFEDPDINQPFNKIRIQKRGQSDAKAYGDERNGQYRRCDPPNAYVRNAPSMTNSGSYISNSSSAETSNPISGVSQPHFHFNRKEYSTNKTPGATHRQPATRPNNVNQTIPPFKDITNGRTYQPTTANYGTNIDYVRGMQTAFQVHGHHDVAPRGYQVRGTGTQRGRGGRRSIHNNNGVPVTVDDQSVHQRKFSREIKRPRTNLTDELANQSKAWKWINDSCCVLSEQREQWVPAKSQFRQPSSSSATSPQQTAPLRLLSQTRLCQGDRVTSGDSCDPASNTSVIQSKINDTSQPSNEDLKFHCSRSFIGSECTNITKLVVLRVPDIYKIYEINAIFQDQIPGATVQEKIWSKDKTDARLPGGRILLVQFFSHRDAIKALNSSQIHWADGSIVRFEVPRQYWDTTRQIYQAPFSNGAQQHGGYVHGTNAGNMLSQPQIHTRQTTRPATPMDKPTGISRPPSPAHRGNLSISEKPSYAASSSGSPKKKNKKKNSKYKDREPRLHATAMESATTSERVNVSAVSSVVLLDSSANLVDVDQTSCPKEEELANAIVDPTTSKDCHKILCENVSLDLRTLGDAKVLPAPQMTMDTKVVEEHGSITMLEEAKAQDKLEDQMQADVLEGVVTTTESLGKSISVHEHDATREDVCLDQATDMAGQNANPTEFAEKVSDYNIYNHESQCHGNMTGQKAHDEANHSGTTVGANWATVTNVDDEQADDSFHTATGSPDSHNDKVVRGANISTQTACKKTTIVTNVTVLPLSSTQSSTPSRVKRSVAVPQIIANSLRTNSIAVSQHLRPIHRSTSDGSSVCPTPTFVTAPNTPVLGLDVAPASRKNNHHQQPVEDAKPLTGLNIQSSATIASTSPQKTNIQEQEKKHDPARPEKPKGPAKTESLNPFGQNKAQKKPKDKKGKNTLKGKPKQREQQMADVMTEPKPETTNGITATSRLLPSVSKSQLMDTISISDPNYEKFGVAKDSTALVTANNKARESLAITALTMEQDDKRSTLGGVLGRIFGTGPHTSTKETKHKKVVSTTDVRTVRDTVDQSIDVVPNAASGDGYVEETLAPLSELKPQKPLVQCVDDETGSELLPPQVDFDSKAGKHISFDRIGLGISKTGLNLSAKKPRPKRNDRGSNKLTASGENSSDSTSDDDNTSSSTAGPNTVNNTPILPDPFDHVDDSEVLSCEELSQTVGQSKMWPEPSTQAAKKSMKKLMQNSTSDRHLVKTKEPRWKKGKRFPNNRQRDSSAPRNDSLVKREAKVKILHNHPTRQSLFVQIWKHCYFPRGAKFTVITPSADYNAAQEDEDPDQQAWLFAVSQQLCGNDSPSESNRFIEVDEFEQVPTSEDIASSANEDVTLLLE